MGVISARASRPRESRAPPTSDSRSATVSSRYSAIGVISTGTGAAKTIEMADAKANSWTVEVFIVASGDVLIIKNWYWK